MKLRLTSIQRFSVHDGPGIRTTLFTKGCSIRCPWCANPENLKPDVQFFVTDKCICDEKGSCMICNNCHAKGDQVTEFEYRNCTVNGIGKYGEDWETRDLLPVCLKDASFYGQNGGVTASGGEALLQAEALTELFEQLHSHKVGCCLETSLYAPERSIQMLAPLLDYIYVDMKIMDKDEASRILGASIPLFERNLEYVFSSIPRDKICVRIPFADGLSYTEKNVLLLGKALNYFQPVRCEMFGVHNLGKKKYISLGWDYSDYRVIQEEELLDIKNYFEGICDKTEFVINRA